MKIKRQIARGWYKYINMCTTGVTVGCSHMWKRFTGETENCTVFRHPEACTHMETVPCTTGVAAFDFERLKNPSAWPVFTAENLCNSLKRLCRLRTVMSTSILRKSQIINKIQKWDFFISVISIIGLMFGFSSHLGPKKGGHFPFCLKKWPFLHRYFQGVYC